MSADSTVRVLSLSRLLRKFKDNPVRCLSAVVILPVITVQFLSVRILSVEILSAPEFCPDFMKKTAVRSRFVRPGKDETELSELSVSLLTDVCPYFDPHRHHFQF